MIDAVSPPRGEIEAWLKLNAARPHSPDQVWAAALVSGPQDLLSGRVAAPANLAEILARARSFDAAAELAKAESLGARVITREDPGYPELLKSIPDAPLALYVMGRLEGPAVPLAFVGSRLPTPYGLRMARSLAGQAAAKGFVVVSGLARGIDTAAHRAALEKGGITWAVLGSGLGNIYPPENAALAREITASGAVLSEMPLDSGPSPENFPWRNRIVAGLSWATVVVEGRHRSGSLITARLAAELGREVFAVPGPADSRMSEAPHRLIRDGAGLAGSLEDVLESLPPGCRAPAGGQSSAPSGCLLGSQVRAPYHSIDDGSGTSPVQGTAGGQSSTEFHEKKRKILEFLGSDCFSMEEISENTGIDINRLSPVLFLLEIEDCIIPVQGQRYAKK